MHAPFAFTNLASALDVPASHLSSSLSAGVWSAVGWCVRLQNDRGDVLAGRPVRHVDLGRESLAGNVLEVDVAVRRMAAGMKKSIEVMNGSAK